MSEPKVHRRDAIEIFLLVRVDEQILTLAKATDHIYDCCDEIDHTGVIFAKFMQEGDEKLKRESGDGIFGESKDGTYVPIKFKEVKFEELLAAIKQLDPHNVNDEYRFSVMEEGSG